MLKSMTAFAQMTTQGSWGQAIWELRSVNHRYLEMSFRLPENFRDLEDRLRQTLREQVTRGKVELALRFISSPQVEAWTLNEGLVEQLLTAANRIATHAKTPLAALNPIDILRWPGTIQTSDHSGDSIRTAVLALFEQAVAALVANRAREGQQLSEVLLAQVASCRAYVRGLRPLLPQARIDHRNALVDRLAQIKSELDERRVEQEMIIFAHKSDVVEELDRLDVHCTEMENTLRSSTAVGKRLDFLLQELNREANTLAAKAVTTEVTKVAVELKVVIEQMREQVQNIE